MTKSDYPKNPRPAGATIISPWADLASIPPSLRTKADSDPWLEAGVGPQRNRLPLRGDPKNLLASPFTAIWRVSHPCWARSVTTKSCSTTPCG